MNSNEFVVEEENILAEFDCSDEDEFKRVYNNYISSLERCNLKMLGSHVVDISIPNTPDKVVFNSLAIGGTILAATLTSVSNSVVVPLIGAGIGLSIAYNNVRSDGGLALFELTNRRPIRFIKKCFSRKDE